MVGYVGVSNALEKLHGPAAHQVSGVVAAKTFVAKHGLQLFAAELERTPLVTTGAGDRSRRSRASGPTL